MKSEQLREWLLRLTSRKFWCAFVIAFIVFGNKYWEWGLEPDEVWKAISGFLAFMGVEGYRDIKAVK